MSKSRPVPSVALLRSLRASVSDAELTVSAQCLAPLPCWRATHTTWQRRQLSTSTCRAEQLADETMSRSFRAQLYESTAERLQREKEAEIRQRESRPTSIFARNAFFTLSIVISSGIAYYIGSSRPLLRHTKSTLSVDEVEPPEKLHQATKLNLQNVWVDLCLIVGDANVSEDHAERQALSGSDGSSIQGHEKAAMIVKPATTEQVSQIMAMCHRRRIPVTVHAGGRSTEGQTNARQGGICIDFQRMNQISNFAADEVTVQPGVQVAELDRQLNQTGMTLPFDLSWDSSIGGMLSLERKAGDSVLNMTVVLADGSVIQTGHSARESAGYDLKRLVMGSEGTLGLITEARLHIVRRPSSEAVISMTFDSMKSATECGVRIFEGNSSITATKILNILPDGRPTLMLKIAGIPAAVRETIDTARRASSSAQSIELARNERASELWKSAIRSTDVAAIAADTNKRVWSTDVAVPPRHLAELVEQTHHDAAERGLVASMAVQARGTLHGG